MTRFDVMTLFPDMVLSPLSESIVGRAQAAGIVKIACHNIRDYSKDKHHRVDDTPYGGGMGMLMMPDPVFDCFEAIVKDAKTKPKLIYLSPKGKLFTQSKAKELAQADRLILLCGHYEGIDQRVLDEIVDEELSIGDYILTGGELAAAVVIDAVCRLIPGVLPDPAAHTEESLENGLLEYPQYTRPRVFHGIEVPEVLQNGDHEKIRAWREEQAIKLTSRLRPDLIEKKG